MTRLGFSLLLAGGLCAAWSAHSADANVRSVILKHNTKGRVRKSKTELRFERVGKKFVHKGLLGRLMGRKKLVDDPTNKVGRWVVESTGTFRWFVKKRYESVLRTVKIPDGPSVRLHVWALTNGRFAWSVTIPHGGYTLKAVLSPNGTAELRSTPESRGDKVTIDAISPGENLWLHTQRREYDLDARLADVGQQMKNARRALLQDRPTGGFVSRWAARFGIMIGRRKQLWDQLSETFDIPRDRLNRIAGEIGLPPLTAAQSADGNITAQIKRARDPETGEDLGSLRFTLDHALESGRRVHQFYGRHRGGLRNRDLALRPLYETSQIEQEAFPSTIEWDFSPRLNWKPLQLPYGQALLPPASVSND